MTAPKNEKKSADDKRFERTVKKMLETPPKPHKQDSKRKKDKGKKK